MKRVLCLFFCILGILFMSFGIVAYIFYHNKNCIPKYINTIMLVNMFFIVFAIVLGWGVLKISIDQWFSGDDGDIMSIKDRFLIFIMVAISLICGGIFVLTIVRNNIDSIRVTEIDNIMLRILMLILANSYVSYAYYQHFQVLNILK